MFLVIPLYGQIVLFRMTLHFDCLWMGADEECLRQGMIKLLLWNSLTYMEVCLRAFSPCRLLLRQGC